MLKSTQVPFHSNLPGVRVTPSHPDPFCCRFVSLVVVVNASAGRRDETDETKNQWLGEIFFGINKSKPLLEMAHDVIPVPDQ